MFLKSCFRKFVTDPNDRHLNYLGSTQLPEKYCTHIMKCLWKVIRGLPTWLPSMEPGKHFSQEFTHQMDI